VPLGCHLSGGLDTSIITHLASEKSKGTIKTFSAGFRHGGVYDDTGYADISARSAGTEHYSIFPTCDDFAENFARLIYFMDEPVAGMSVKETESTAELILSISKNHSVLVIDHDMDFIKSIAQKVTVLHDDTVLCEGTMDEVQKDERVIEKYLGRGK